MIEIIILVFVGYTGWKQMPWWAPVGGTLLSLAVTLFKIARISEMRRETGLPPYEAMDYAGSMLTILVLYASVYALCRWLAVRRANKS